VVGRARRERWQGYDLGKARREGGGAVVGGIGKGERGLTTESNYSNPGCFVFYSVPDP
jgi:hypothetical protein